MGRTRRAEFADAPTFCCCEFIDRHGERAHLGDASACDDFIARCCCPTSSPRTATDVLLDMDDRLRLPQYNGAVHIGFEGLVAALIVPVSGVVASRSPAGALGLLIIMPLLFAQAHQRTLRSRRRSRFFVCWSAASFAYFNLVFTIRLGEQIPFEAWLACAVLHVTAAARASAVRAAPLPQAGEATDSTDEESTACEPLRQAESTLDAEPGSGSATVHDGGEDGSGGSDGTVRCSLCGQHVAGYDHHCIWLDACIGAHNLGVFARGLLGLAAVAGLQAALCGSLAYQRGLWGAEAAMTLFAAVVCLAVCLLLGQVLINLARGTTAYELRRLRRLGRPLPPVRAALLLRHMGTLLLCGAVA